EVGYLYRELPKISHEIEVKDILRQVAQICHSLISEAFSKLGKGLEEEKVLLQNQKHEYDEKLTHLEAALSQSSSRNLELEQELFFVEY
ncbi:hypothetical protein FRX31_003823, partial [Thalictrum thalictroides]